MRRMQMMTSHNTTLRDEGYRQCVRTDRSRSTTVPSSATRRGGLRAPGSGRFVTPTSPSPPFTPVDVEETAACRREIITVNSDAGLPSVRATQLYSVHFNDSASFFFGYRIIIAAARNVGGMAEMTSRRQNGVIYNIFIKE